MKYLELEVSEKKYYLGYGSRDDAKTAELNGLDITKSGQLITTSETLFYTGLLAKQPEMTREEANTLLDKYLEEGGELSEITSFLLKQYMAFTKSPAKKKKKTIRIVEL